MSCELPHFDTHVPLDQLILVKVILNLSQLLFCP